MDKHERYMNVAIREALTSIKENGIPIGACLVKDGKIVGRGRNRRVQNDNQIAHAEMEAFRDAGRGNYNGVTLYTTLYPCRMCAAAASLFGISRIVVGEARTFQDDISAVIAEMSNIEIIILDLEEPRILLRDYIKRHEEIWNEDIGR